MKIKIEAMDSTSRECVDCGSACLRKEYYILRDEHPWCVALVEKHKPLGADPELHISVIFGNLSEDEPDPSRTTFTCRYGYDIDGQDTPAYSLIKETSSDEVFGLRLDRDEALRHPFIDDLWMIIDELQAKDDNFFTIERS